MRGTRASNPGSIRRLPRGPLPFALWDPLIFVLFSSLARLIIVCQKVITSLLPYIDRCPRDHQAGSVGGSGLWHVHSSPFAPKG